MPQSTSNISSINPIYDQFFPVNGSAPRDWTPFKKYQALSKPGEKPSAPDLSISAKKTWKDTAKMIALTFLKIILFPWGLYEGAKALIERLVMLIVYPAQLNSTMKMNALREEVEKALNHELISKDFIGREVALEKNGVRYTGLLFGHKSTISNGKWALFATGNSATIEEMFLGNGEVPYLQAGFNILMVNGPGVGTKEKATVAKLGDAQEAGITFLESNVKAKEIVLAGHSLGAAAMGQAILKHTFKPDIHYRAMPMMTFDRLSHVVKKLAGSFAGKLVSWSAEMDNVAASRKLQKEGIHETVIQGGAADQIMDQVELLGALQKENLMDNKTAIFEPYAEHGDLPHRKITQELQKWDRSLQPAVAG